MGFQDIAPLPLHAPATRPKLVSLHIDSTNLQTEDSTDDGLSSSPSSAAATNSPVTPFVPRPPSSGSETVEEEEKHPASGPQRSTAESVTKGEKEKRKRSRVTPEQLVHLERFFAADRSPTAARRREISDLLGMQERQTQIWFQNRRAKAKLLESKPNTSKGRTQTPPDSPPELSSGIEVDLQQLIHEDEPVTIIPCTDLSVGTWRRIATTAGKHDLVAYVSDIKRCLTWFIQSGGHGFKMEIPFGIIIDTRFTHAAPGSGLATFVLSQPPLFYLEQLGSPLPDGTPMRYWKRCTDWTEGFQATSVLRHDLVGSAVQLAHIVRTLNSSVVDSEIALHSPSYNPEPHTPMEIPSAPPMAALGADFNRRDSPPPDSSRKRYSAPGILDQSDDWTSITRAPPHSAPIGTFSSSYRRGMTGGYDGFEHQMPHTEYAVPISQSLASRPVPLQRTFSEASYEAVQRPYSTHFTYVSAPPLLTTPYHPPPQLTHGTSDSQPEQVNGSITSATRPMILPF